MDALPPLPELNRRAVLRIVYAQAGQLILIVGSITMLLFAMSVTAIIIQAQPQDVRSAERMIVVGDADPDPALVRYVVVRQRRNITPQIRVIGTAPERLAEQLRQAGISDADLEIAAPAALAQQLHPGGAPPPPTTLILAEPHALVLMRKISRDRGLDANVAAPPDLSLRIGPTLHAAVEYWQYTLYGTP